MVQLQTKNKPRLLLLGALVVIILGLMGYGGYRLWQKYEATHDKNATVGSQIVTWSVAEPQETPPTESCENYTVPAVQPRKIAIPSIGVDTCIQRVGVDQHSAIAVPDNVHLAGWYVNSVRPGGSGVSIIDGHVSGRYSEAVFANLGSVSTGDSVNIEMGDGQQQVFTVVDTNQYSVEETTKRLFSRIEGVDAQLTLITCGGTFDKQTQSYDKRIVVRAKLKI